MRKEAVERGGVEVKSSKSHNVLDVDVDFGFEPELAAAAAVAEEPKSLNPQSSSTSTLTLIPPSNESSPAQVACEISVVFCDCRSTVAVVAGWRFLSSANRAANVRVCGLGFAGNGADVFHRSANESDI